MIGGARVLVAGAGGLLGSAIVRRLDQMGYDLITPSREEVDFRDRDSVIDLFRSKLPNYVFLAAGRVGGIKQNILMPVEFLSDNILIQGNIIDASFAFGVKKLLFFGSNCMYPSECSQPMKENYVMTGPLEPTNRAYAIAKLAGLEMCRSYNTEYGTNFIVAIPASMYGENDSFSPGKAHVIPELIRKFDDAARSGSKEVVLMGDGSPIREFIHADDVADASLFLMNNFNPSRDDIGAGNIHINVGTDRGYKIRDLADIIKSVVGYNGNVRWDTEDPMGMKEKVLDSTSIKRLGWTSKIDIVDGISRTYKWYLQNLSKNR